MKKTEEFYIIIDDGKKNGVFCLYFEVVLLKLFSTLIHVQQMIYSCWMTTNTFRSSCVRFRWLRISFCGNVLLFFSVLLKFGLRYTTMMNILLYFFLLLFIFILSISSILRLFALLLFYRISKNNINCLERNLLRIIIIVQLQRSIFV